MRAILDKITAWLLLAAGTGGLYFFVVICFEATPMRWSLWYLWPPACILALIYAVWRLRRIEASEHAATPRRRPQLTMIDLVIVSFTMALFLAIVSMNDPDEFVRVGIWGGGALLAAMILALLRASRLGYHRGLQRAGYSIGTVLTLLGIGGVGLLLFLCIFATLLGEFSEFSRWLTREGRGMRVSVTAILGALALAVGRVTVILATRPRRPDGPGTGNGTSPNDA